MKKKIFRALALASANNSAIAIDQDLLNHSRAAQVGQKLIHASLFINLIAPMLTIVAFFSLTAVSVMAQGSSGGSIFGGNDQTVGNGIREAIKWGRRLMFLLGVVFVIWGIVNYATEKSYMKQGIGAVLAFGFGGVASMLFSFSQGQAVNFDTDLGE